MAEPWPNAFGRNVQYPTGAPERSEAIPESQLDLPELPGSAGPANNPALNRSAEVVGRSVGAAVAGVRRLPHQLDRLRSHIHIVSGRGDVAGSVSSLKDSALDKAAEWRDAAEDTVDELKERAEVYTYAITDRANRRLEELWHRTEWRVHLLRRRVRVWLGDARHWDTERPLQVIGGCAAAAFVLGVALRIWRSNSE